jgi:hypothetical protein
MHSARGVVGRALAIGSQFVEGALQLDRQLDHRRQVGFDPVAHLEQEAGAVVEPGLDRVEAAVDRVEDRACSAAGDAARE